MLCAKCNNEKSEEGFYKNDRTCKECRKESVRENRKNNSEYYKDYDRKRANNPVRIAARLEYSKTENGKEALRRGKKKWAKSNPIKRGANVMVGNAIRDGKIEKPSVCSNCDSDNVKIHGHHDDYSKPLVVRWLCTQCHTKWHAENGEGVNG